MTGNAPPSLPTSRSKKEGAPTCLSVGAPSKAAAPCSPACAVPSARPGLASLFGMGRGGTPGLWLPLIWTAYVDRMDNRLDGRPTKEMGD